MTAQPSLSLAKSMVGLGAWRTLSKKILYEAEALNRRFSRLNFTLAAWMQVRAVNLISHRVKKKKHGRRAPSSFLFDFIAELV